MTRSGALLMLAVLAVSLLGALSVCEDGCACHGCSLVCASCSCCQSLFTASPGSDPSAGGDIGPAFVGLEGTPQLHEPLSVFHVPKLT
ncbi:MAG: hypothetical protein QOF89_6020 [Acidobacteriota bacterium]|jgi:hypothetical protein|nr:hypothetical protein [Acidobacteriota bacterium]